MRVPTRAKVPVPSELLAMVWPGIDERYEAAKKAACLPGGDVSAYGFTGLVRMLRTALIQDSVFLMEAMPGHPIWEHAVFQSEVYKAFANTMRAHVAAAKELDLPLTLQQVSDLADMIIM